METIGEYLKRIRQERGLSVEDLAKKTRISPVFIRALEENRLEDFPGEVFARGFVRAYSRSLGLDDQDTMKRFSQAAQDFFQKKDETRQISRKQEEDAQAKREQTNRILQMGVVIALGLAVILVYEMNSRLPKNSSQSGSSPVESSPPEEPVDVPGVPSERPSDLLGPAVNKPGLDENPGLPTVSPAPPPTLREVGAPEGRGPALPPAETRPPSSLNLPGPRTEAPVASPGSGLVLVIEAVEPTWLSAVIDSGSTREVFLKAGEKVTWKAGEQFLVNLGNAGGVKVELNGKELPAFGASGQVVKNILLKRE